MTVKEYAEFQGISLAAAYKRVNENRVKSEKKFGKLVVAIKEKEYV